MKDRTTGLLYHNKFHIFWCKVMGTVPHPEFIILAIFIRNSKSAYYLLPKCAVTWSVEWWMTRIMLTATRFLCKTD